MGGGGGGRGRGKGGRGEVVSERKDIDEICVERGGEKRGKEGEK